MLFELLNEGRQLVVSGIRRYFAESTDAVNYRYSQDEDKSKIAIWDEYPMKTEVLPCIIVTSVVGPGQELAFNQVGDKAFDNETGLLKGYYYQGSFLGSYSLEVRAAAAIERNQIADILITGLVHDIRNDISVMSEHNMVCERPFFTVSASSVRPLTDNQQLYTITLGQKYIQMWYKLVPLETDVTRVTSAIAVET